MRHFAIVLSIPTLWATAGGFTYFLSWLFASRGDMEFGLLTASLFGVIAVSSCGVWTKYLVSTLRKQYIAHCEAERQSKRQPLQ